MGAIFPSNYIDCLFLMSSMLVDENIGHLHCIVLFCTSGTLGHSRGRPSQLIRSTVFLETSTDLILSPSLQVVDH